MQYTNILRMCLSGLRRIPGQVAGRTHLMGQCQNLTPSSRLITVRRYGALAPRISIDNSQHSLFCTSPCLISVFNTQITRYSVASEESQESKRGRYNKQDEESKILFKKQLERGVVQTPRTITSLPEKFKMTGNETFVTLFITVIGKFPNIELFSITASSGSDSFQQVCKPTQEFAEYIAKIAGMEYDENLDQVLRDGKPVEATDPKEALQQFIDFLKKHKNPVLVFYSPSDDKITSLSFLMNKWGLLDDFISEVPYCINAMDCVKKVLPSQDDKNMDLYTVCEKFMGLKVEKGDELERARAIRHLFTAILSLFTEHLQQLEIMPMHTYSFFARNSLKFLRGGMNKSTRSKLATAGIGLDHLNFLAKKGADEFINCLVDRGLQKHDAEKLYSVFQK